METPRNAVLNLGNSPGSIAILQALLASTKDKGDGRIKCTITQHRLAKTAVLVGTQLLKMKPAGTLLSIIERWAPRKRKGQPCENFGVVLECTSTPGLIEEVDLVWKMTNGAVSHRRVMTAALCLGLETLNRVDPIKVRKLVSKVCPINKKYWDPEAEQWL